MTRVIVIAGDKASGYAEARALGIEPVAVVTPRSPAAARGKVADQLMDATTITPEWRDRLVPDVLPSLATTKRILRSANRQKIQGRR